MVQVKCHLFDEVLSDHPNQNQQPLFSLWLYFLITPVFLYFVLWLIVPRPYPLCTLNSPSKVRTLASFFIHAHGRYAINIYLMNKLASRTWLYSKKVYKQGNIFSVGPFGGWQNSGSINCLFSLVIFPSACIKMIYTTY